MFMTVFSIHCNFFTVLPIRLKTCRAVFFLFYNFLGASQRFCVPERAQWASGVQFVMASHPIPNFCQQAEKNNTYCVPLLLLNVGYFRVLHSHQNFHLENPGMKQILLDHSR